MPPRCFHACSLDVRANKCGIEVKAEENVHANSLRTFIDKHPELKGLRISMKPYQDQQWMENRPLYADGQWL